MKPALVPHIGDRWKVGKVVAIGIKDGERWVMTQDQHGTIGLWPDGTWEGVR